MLPHKDINGDIESINVFGLSLSSVDIPYLIDIRKTFPNVKWNFSCYDSKSKKRICKIAETELGLSKSEYKLFDFNNSNSFKIQSEIVMMQGIKEYQMVKHKEKINSIA